MVAAENTGLEKLDMTVEEFRLATPTLQFQASLILGQRFSPQVRCTANERLSDACLYNQHPSRTRGETACRGIDSKNRPVVSPPRAMGFTFEIRNVPEDVLPLLVHHPHFQ